LPGGEGEEKNYENVNHRCSESYVTEDFFKADFSLTNCELCSKEAPLRDSHIIPRFVFEWLRNTSATGHIRFGENPNLRVQDGWKPKLLCDQCEQTFSAWETIFSERVFVPLHSGVTGPLRYESWMGKFAVSISWRVLTGYKYIGGLSDFPPEIIERSNAALQCWKEFLLGVRPHPGDFEQHLMPLDIVADSTIPGTPPNINRYFLRSVDIYVAHAKTSALVYSKMGRLALFGLIEMPSKNKWRGTKLHMGSGVLGGVRRYTIPKNVGEFLMNQAKRMASVKDKISDRQWQKIDEAYRSNVDQAVQSEGFLAMHADVALFGRAAFRAEDNSE
jgi:hypothetical protein